MGNDQSVPYEPSPYADACVPQPTKSALRRARSIRQEAAARNGGAGGGLGTSGGYHDLLNVSQLSSGSAATNNTASTAATAGTGGSPLSPNQSAATASVVAGAASSASESPPEKQQKPRYLPNMQPAGRGIVPSRPYGPSSLMSSHQQQVYPHHQHRQSDPGPASAATAEMSPQWGWYINTTPPTPEMYHSSSTLGGGCYPPHKILTGAAFPHQLGAANVVNTVPGIDDQGRNGGGSSVRPRLSTTGGGATHNPVFQHLQANNQHNAMGWTPVPI